MSSKLSSQANTDQFQQCRPGSREARGRSHRRSGFLARLGGTLRRALGGVEDLVTMLFGTPAGERAMHRLLMEPLERRDLLTITIDVGDHYLLPNTADQWITLSVTSSNPLIDPVATGFKFNSQVGDGTGPLADPIVQAVDFGGTIWDADSFPTTITGAQPLQDKYTQTSVVFNTSGDNVAAHGILGKLKISTVGLAAGAFDLKLSNTDIGEASKFILFGGVDLLPNASFVINNGRLTIDDTPLSVTVTPLRTSDTTPMLTGTVQGGTPSVVVNGKTYAPGDGNLTVNGSDWALQIPSGDALALGTYSVAATVTGGEVTVVDATRDELVIVAPTDLAIAAAAAVKPEGNSGTTAFTFTVDRAGLMTGSTSVNWAVTGSGTNQANAADFFGGTLPSGSVRFAATETSQTITVGVRGDTIGEPDESFTVSLSGASGGATILTPTAEGMILNDDGSNTLRVTSLTTTTSGLSIEFNRAVAVANLNLYDASTGSLGPADLTMIGSSTGPVRGSLIAAADNQHFTFVRTGGRLAADTYTVTLRSAVNGFTDTAGGLLDGNTDGTPGDDHIAVVAIAAGPPDEVLISIPDFARGFGQAVNLPNNTSIGIPITLSTGQSVTSTDFDLVYDPALLTITDFTTAIPGASAAFNGATPGLLRVSVSSATDFSAAAGQIELGRITAVVPDTALYASKHVLDLTNVVVENVAVPRTSRADDGVHVAAYVGDTSGNKSYSGGDATLIQRLVVGIDDGLTAFQLADPLLIADVNRGGTLSSGDATLVQRLVVGIPITQAPPPPSGITAPSTGGPDPQLYIPRDLSGLPGETVTVPVRLRVTEPAGISVASVTLAIAFDSSRFAIGNFRLGGLLAGSDFMFTHNTSLSGTLRVTMSSSVGPNLPFDAEGDVFLFDLTVASTAPGGSTPINLLQNIESTKTSVENNAIEELTLIPAPSNADNDSVDGLITIPSADNEPPAVVNQSATVNGGATLVLTSSHLSATDPDSDDAALIFTLKSLPANGQLTKEGSALAVAGTFTPADITAGKIRYAHNGSETTSDSFTFTVQDPAGNETAVTTFTIAVTPVNDPPVIFIAPIPLVIDEDTLGILPAGALSFSDPDPGSGLVQTTIAVTNGTVSLGSAVGLTFTAGDGTADTLMTFTSTIDALNTAVVNSVFTPTQDFFGNAEIEITLDDQGNTLAPARSDTKTVTITVNSVNDRPVLDAIGDKSVDDQATLAFGATASDQDLPAQRLTFSLDAASLALGMTITAGGQFSWTPTEAQGGASYPVTVTVTDNGTPPLSDEEEITVTVTSSDQEPPVVTVSGLTTNDTTPVITGTVSEGALQVVIHGRTYTAGDGSLTVIGTVWALQIPAGNALPEGTYEVAASSQDAQGNVGNDDTTDELVVDTTKPSSRVDALPERATTKVFTVSVTGQDPAGGGGAAASGVAEYRIYVSTNQQAFAYWTTVPADQPSAVFTAQSAHVYGFRSLAVDRAGNVESKLIASDAWTRVPDLDAPSTQVDAYTVDADAGLIRLTLSGTDAGGSGLAQWQLWVQIDSQEPVKVGDVTALCGSGDVYEGSAVYQGQVGQHSYRFFTIGVDGNGNVETPAEAPLDVIVDATFSPPQTSAVLGFDVQRGTTQRSFIRYLDVAFNRANEIQAIIDSVGTGSERLQLARYDLTGQTSVPVSLAGAALSANAVDRALQIDFGTTGIGGNPNGLEGNGYYRLSLDADGDSTNGLETDLFFYRLAGDVNGDRRNDSLDLLALNSVLNGTPWDVNGDGTIDGQDAVAANVNGDGAVTSADRLLVMRGRNKSIAPQLPLDD